jgi:hypothetical protein
MDDDNFLSAPESPSIMFYERLEDVIYAIRTFEKVSTIYYVIRTRTTVEEMSFMLYERSRFEKMYFDRNRPSPLARRARSPYPRFSDDVYL